VTFISGIREPMEKYENVKQVGEGAFGQVYKSKRRSDGAVVAIKKVPIDKEQGFPFTAIREVRLCRKITSEHIIRLEEVFFEGEHLFMVMEYMVFDLTGLICSGVRLSEEQQRSLVSQLIVATKSIHEQGLVHRDIKASNILINAKGVLKLADFGLTRDTSGLMTNRVCTLWYRAPELLLGETSYDCKIDAWSIGCVMLEMRLGKTPFKGSDEISQVKLILSEFGMPEDRYKWSDLFGAESYGRDKSQCEIIHEKYGTMFNHEELRLLSGFLCLTSRRRLSVINASHFPIVKDYQKRHFPIESGDRHEFYTRKAKT
jgi:serine/threonine protein kinase